MFILKTEMDGIRWNLGGEKRYTETCHFHPPPHATYLFLQRGPLSYLLHFLSVFLCGTCFWCLCNVGGSVTSPSSVLLWLLGNNFTCLEFFRCIPNPGIAAKTNNYWIFSQCQLCADRKRKVWWVFINRILPQNQLAQESNITSILKLPNSPSGHCLAEGKHYSDFSQDRLVLCHLLMFNFKENNILTIQYIYFLG